METAADALVGLSVVAVILGAVGAFIVDVWLAPTQWLLVAAVLAVWGTYVRLRAT